MFNPPAELDAFHRFCLANPHVTCETFRHMERRLPVLHAIFGNAPTPFSPTPFLFDAKGFRRMAAICASLTDLLEEVGRRVLSNEDLLSVYQFPQKFLDILPVDPGYSRLAPVFRLDGHFVKNIFRVVETNADGSAGMNDSNAIERAALEAPAYGHFQKRLRLHSVDMISPLAKILIAYARRSVKPGSKKIRIGILDIPGAKTASEFLAIQESLRRHGAEVLILSPRDLSRRGGLYARGARLNLIYRRMVTVDALRIWSALGPLLTAYRRRQICVVGSFRSELLHNKAILAVVHDRRIQEKLKSSDRQLIERHIPKAMGLSGDKAERAASSRKNWVLKPLGQYGSRGVVIGRLVSAAQWKRALKDALKNGRYLLQEYIPSTREKILRMDQGRPRVSNEMTSVGFFVYDGAMAGAYVRSGPRHPLSISYGAITRPGFIAERRP